MHILWVGRGRGFIPCFSSTLPPFSFFLQPCVRLVRTLGALLRIFNILACLSNVSPWSVAAPYLLCLFFFCGAWCLWRKDGDIWLWFVFVRMLYDVRVGSSFFLSFCVRRCPFGTLLHNILGFFTYACVAGDI